MVALGCGVALLPEVVLENSPEPVRNPRDDFRAQR
ncbi:DNA-binding transcriptional regulator IlvY [Leclercia adecarboxylata]|uniref:DNA-binding transcriptional regulator IlvY n=1 Tax=Leclercia adecarboxylata TaxID=83655 RepID=A0A4U9IVV7_9ENTR|nr:DNA-binding transcriptional regulator IlvY [Leclercia adecarboxylata]